MIVNIVHTKMILKEPRLFPKLNS